MDNKPEQIREEIFKLQNLYSLSLDKFISKVKALVVKQKELSLENHTLKETIKEVNAKLTEMKLQLNKINSDSLLKDREISELKNLLLLAEDNKTIVRDKEFVKSRLKELISRIDVHLEQYEEEGEGD